MTDHKQLAIWLEAVLSKARDERGFSLSIEQLLWIIGIAAIAGVVVLALNGYINGLLAKL
jgi:hypothetical protein